MLFDIYLLLQSNRYTPSPPLFNIIDRLESLLRILENITTKFIDTAKSEAIRRYPQSNVRLTLTLWIASDFDLCGFVLVHSSLSGQLSTEYIPYIAQNINTN